jgi:hypothetical protein
MIDTSNIYVTFDILHFNYEEPGPLLAMHSAASRVVVTKYMYLFPIKFSQ